MEKTYVFMALLVIVPLIGAIINLAMFISARNSLQTDDMFAENQNRDDKSEMGRFIILLATGGPLPIYGIMEVFLLAMRLGMMNGNVATELPQKFITAMIVSMTLSFISGILMGIVGAKAIRAGGLNENKFSMTMTKVSIPHMLTILGLLYFFLTIQGAI